MLKVKILTQYIHEFGNPAKTKTMNRGNKGKQKLKKKKEGKTSLMTKKIFSTKL